MFPQKLLDYEVDSDEEWEEEEPGESLSHSEGVSTRLHHVRVSPRRLCSLTASLCLTGGVVWKFQPAFNTQISRGT